jgi:hypothetical protein
MNRDEKLTRAIGTPPRKRRMNGRAVLCPAEPGGGTWIALNDSGASLALINWYSVTKRVERSPVSRGEVVKAVGAADSAEAASAGLNELPLKRINPFRLIGIFPASGEIVEWRWNLKRLVRKKAPWRTQQWISSGFDEPVAQRVRGGIFRDALLQKPARLLSWLRRLHRSDAATVSYTEITVSSRTATMRYHAGTPCRSSAPPHERRLRSDVGRAVRQVGGSNPAVFGGKVWTTTIC